MNKLINGDCLESLKLIDNNSIDLVLIDPPYSSGGGCLPVIARLTPVLSTATTITTVLVVFRPLLVTPWTNTHCWPIGPWFSVG